MTEIFVVGFAFNLDRSMHVTMRKKRPAPIAGLLCGPGGKVENNDHSIFHAMMREFAQETGVITTPYEWAYIQNIADAQDNPVSILCAFGDQFLTAKTVTDEDVFVLSVAHTLQRDDLVPEYIEMVSRALDDNYPKMRLANPATLPRMRR